VKVRILREQQSDEPPPKTPQTLDSSETPIAFGAPPAHPNFGKYRLLTSIGKGGMGEVFLAVLKGLPGSSKLVVLKRLRDVCADDPEMRDLFLVECRLAARLNHPNVVQTNEVGEERGALYFTMEYLEGEPLNRIVAKSGSAGLDRGMAARIVSDALAGLHHAQELCDYDGTPLQLVHRDISPHNIFITFDGVTKVLDFGVAKVAWTVHQRTQAGVVKGKIGYMAPEQLSGTVDRRTDIYSMGVVLWELIAKRKLMEPRDMAAMLHELVTMTAPRLSTVVRDVDPELDHIVARALEPKPENRFQSAKEMREALEDYLARSRHFVRSEDIAQLVDSLFGGKRQLIQQQVREFMATVDEPISYVKAVSHEHEWDREDEQPTRRPAPPEEPIEPEVTSRSVFHSEPSQRKRWSSTTMLAAVALAAVVTVLAVSRLLPNETSEQPSSATPAETTQKSEPTAAPEPVLQPQPTASESPAPSSSASARPTRRWSRPVPRVQPDPEPPTETKTAPQPAPGKRKFRTEF
jgi:serine/threonine protein kinase